MGETQLMERDEDIYNNIRIDRLLKCFDNSTRKELLDFCRRVSSAKADVYFLMARKASCFFYCLEELGLISLDGYVTSERVLDMNTEWLRDKDIIIIDDAIVSGTSINQTIEKLNAAKVKSIKVYVLSVNQKWFQADMLTDANGGSYLFPNCNVATNENCINICYQVVKAILLQPRPYDIDFPLFNEFDVKKSNFSRLINMPYWNVYDVSTVEQQENDILSLTFVPTSLAIEKFEKTEKCCIRDCSLIKIRTYITHKTKNKDTYTVRVLPMIVFDKIKVENINTVFENIIKTTKIKSEEFSETSAKLRLVQYFYSYKLAVFWNSFLPKELEINLGDLMIEQKNIRFIFTPKTESEIRLLCKKSHSICLPLVQFERIKTANSSFKSNIDGVDYVSIEARLMEPFLNLYHNKEIACRKLVLEKGKEAFKDNKYNELLQRLNKGISIGDLLNIIEYANDYYDCLTKVSLFIDKSVDMGIIVPITQEKDGYIFRAFRHGEDVVFGEKEETLYTSFLYEFQKENNKENAISIEGITHISAEKLIVLFSQIGIRLGLLTEYTLNFPLNPNDDNIRILRIKTHLKGPVGVLGNVTQHAKTKNYPYITTEQKSQWLTNVLNKKNKITNSPEGGYKIKEPDVSALLTWEKADVETMGILFGKLCNDNEDTGVTFGDAELTKISTCLSREDCIKAVAAELNIFDGYYYQLSEDEDIFDNKTAYEALNSALMKLKAFETGEAADLVKKVHFSNRTDQNIWIKWFSSVFDGSTNDTEDDKLKEDILELYYDCKYITIFILRLCLWLSKINFLNNKKKTKSKAYAKLDQWNSLDEECKSFCDEKEAHIKKYQIYIDAIETIEKEVEKCCQGKGVSLVVHEYIPTSINDNIYSLISRLDKTTKATLEVVCCMLSKRGKLTRSISYGQALYFSYQAKDINTDDNVINIVNLCISKIQESRRDIKLAILQEKYCPDIILEESWKALWFVSSGNTGADALAALTLNLSYMLKNIPMKFTYLGDITHENSIKRSEDEAGEFLCNNFNTYVMDLPFNIFSYASDKKQLTTVVEKTQSRTNRFFQYIEDVKIQKTDKFRYKKCKENTIKIDDKAFVVRNYEERFVFAKVIEKDKTSSTPKDNFGSINEGILLETTKSKEKERNEKQMNIFIGSSSEAKEYMHEIAGKIEELGHKPILWDDQSADIFCPGTNTIDAIIDISKKVNAAVFIFNADDKVWNERSKLSSKGYDSVRDNVLFEYGLFVGALGKEKVCFVCKNNPKLASDLVGITYIDGNKGNEAVRSKLKTWIGRCNN
ncbi:MAG: nucleotide-binding protein [Lachnospiraceae bacterium]|nr:nucleotide-binding protein [Lachnospiraceae bacterium]